VLPRWRNNQENSFNATLQEQEWSLSSLIQAHEEQRCSLETFEINIDPILRHKLAKYALPVPL
jgi:hypothetical protein